MTKNNFDLMEESKKEIDSFIENDLFELTIKIDNLIRKEDYAYGIHSKRSKILSKLKEDLINVAGEHKKILTAQEIAKRRSPLK